MTVKTFLVMIAVLITIMIGIISYQIFTLPNDNCLPSVTQECMNTWTLLCNANCGGEHVGDWLLWAACDGETCVGTYRYYCDCPDGRKQYYGTCANTAHWQCTSL